MTDNATRCNVTIVLGVAPHIPEPVFMALGILSSTIIAIGIPGNFLVILSVCLNKHLRNAANLLVLSLSVCDLIFLALIVPFHTFSYLNGRPLIPALCWTIGFATIWIIGASVLSTGVIAVNRYIAVVLNNKYRYISGNKVVIAMCISAYTVPFVLIAPAFNAKFGTMGFDTVDRRCGLVDDKVVKTILILGLSAIPFCLMTVCYIRILLHVVASRKRVAAVGQQNSITGNQRVTEARLTLMLSIVYVVYFLTTFPTFFFRILGQSGVHVSQSMQATAFTLVWTSSAINPIIYGLVNKNYRAAYRRLAVRITESFKRNEIQTTETNTR